MFQKERSNTFTGYFVLSCLFRSATAAKIVCVLQQGLFMTFKIEWFAMVNIRFNILIDIFIWLLQLDYYMLVIEYDGPALNGHCGRNK